MPGLLVAAGLITGTIDAIIGGGALISLPILALSVGEGAPAVGTNKIVGATAAITALIIYSSKGHLKIKDSVPFMATAITGSLIGSLLTQFIPVSAFKWMVIAVSPAILVLTLKRDTVCASQFKRQEEGLSNSLLSNLTYGLLCGIYDGACGIGSGTLMLVALYAGARRPLLESLSSAKLANSASALIALWSFHRQGHVHWQSGGAMAIGTGMGALLGSWLAMSGIERAVKPMLATISIILFAKMALAL